MRKIFLFLLMLGLLAGIVSAQTTTSDVSLAWDDTDTGVTFRVYRSQTAGVYTKDCSVTPTINCRSGIATKTYVWTRPLQLGINYFVVTAYAIINGGEVESAYSNEVNITIRPQSPSANRIVSYTASVTGKSINFMAATNMPSIMSANYSSGRNSFTVSDKGKPTTDHSFSIKTKDLKPHTLYAYTLVANFGMGERSTASGIFMTP